MNSVIESLLLAWLFAAILQAILWIGQVKTRNASTVDIGWTLSIFLTAIILCINLDGDFHRAVLTLSMVGLWALRLTYHLVVRIFHEGHEDKRYQRMRVDWGSNIDMKFFFFYQFQAILGVLLACVFIAPLKNTATPLSIIEILAVFLWIIGFVGESIADRQLKAFKADPANKGKTCDFGLWFYSRHPNYFFEWLMWVAYFIFGLASGATLWTIFIPLVMLYLLTMVSGIPLAEAQSLLSRGEAYRRYQMTTSMFIPWFKRKASV